MPCMAGLGMWLAAALCFMADALAEQGTAALQARQQNLETSWTRELQPDTKVKTYTSPVKRVTNLLKKMKAELQAEANKEAEMYDKMVCWCEENQKEKSEAVKNAEAKDLELSAEIESRGARFGELSASIQNSKEEIAENTKTLDTATSIREDEAAKFRGEEKDMVQAVTNLRNAIAVLSKHQTTQSLLQMDGTVLTGMRVLLRDLALKHEETVAARMERHNFDKGEHDAVLVSIKAERAHVQGGGVDSISSMLLSALELRDSSMSDVLPLNIAERLVSKAAQPDHAARSNKFLQVDEHQPLYESRSSARSAGIYGVLTQMLEEFEAELAAQQKQELQAQEDYKALASAKSAEIEAGKKKLDEMELEDAANRKALSDANEDLEVTREQRSADVKFLQNLQTSCNDIDTTWQKRSETRAAETKAVAEAIAILTEDDNRELLAKSVSLMQQHASISASSESNARRASAAATLRHMARSPIFEADDLLSAWHRRSTPTVGAAAGPRAQLSTLAMAVQLDSFTKVKEMMDKMVVNLKEEQEEEVQFKAYCGKEFNQNEKMLHDNGEMKKDLEANINRLDTLIQKLQEEIKQASSQIADTELEIKKASQAREAENADFQSIVADQRATQSVLKKALHKLKDFYEKGIGHVALAQRSVQEPPVKFNSYATNAGSTPVIGLIQQILEDSTNLEAETTAAEFKGQADYEKFVKDSNDLIKSLQNAVTAKRKAIASAKVDLAESDEDLDNTNSKIESLTAYEADLHNQCDFVLKNFDIRQKARLQEIEAIQAAKTILSGAK